MARISIRFSPTTTRPSYRPAAICRTFGAHEPSTAANVIEPSAIGLPSYETVPDTGAVTGGEGPPQPDTPAMQRAAKTILRPVVVAFVMVVMVVMLITPVMAPPPS